MAIKKFNSVAGFSVGELDSIIDVVDSNANVTANRLVVSDTSNLGDVGNITITGGSSGYVLKTDGSGHLSWGIDSAAAGGSTTQVQFNDAGIANGSANFTFNKSTSLLTVTGNILTGNANLGNLTTSNYFSGNGSLLTALNGANVTGTVGNATHATVADSANAVTGGNVSGEVASANIAWRVSSSSQPNITSVGTLVSANITGNLSSGNANLGNLTTSNYFSGNGSLLTSLTGANITGTVANANYSAYAGNVTASSQPNITSVGTLVSANITGNLSSGNANLGNLTTSNYFSGNGSLLTSLTGANVTGTVANANYAAYAGNVVTAAQPNITSVGTLTGLTVSGDSTLTGNLTVTGTTIYANVSTLNIKDPIIEQGGNPDGTPLPSNDGKDRGSLLHYYSSAPTDAFMGWDNSNAEFAFGSNVSVASDVVTFNSFGNVRANNFIGNLVGTSTNALTVINAAQPNITSTGTLTSLTVSGLITATGTGIKTSNIVDSTGTTTITTGYGSHSGDVGITANLVVGTGGSGNISASNANLGNLVEANYFKGAGNLLSNIYGPNVSGTVANANYSAYTGNVVTAAQPNITSVGTLTSLVVSGNANTGNANLGNLAVANFFSGDGGLLTNLTAGSNLVNGNSNVRVYANGNIAISATGNANVVVISSNTATVTGNLAVSNNITRDSKNIPTFVSDASAPSNPKLGDEWYDTVNDIIYQYIYDGVSYYWIDVSSGYIGANVDAVANTLALRDSNANLYANNYIGNTIAVTGIANLGSISNVKISGGTNGYVIQTDGAGNLSFISAGSTGIAGSNTQVQFNDNGAFGANSAFTFNKTTGTLSATIFSGAGNLLSNIQGANVTGTVANATYATSAGSATTATTAGTVTTAAQPNITSVGTLSSLDVTANANVGNINATNGNLAGNLTITGNLIVSGSTEYTNVTNLYVKDPIIEMGGAANGAPLASNDGKDRGTLLHYYTTGVVDAFMGWDNSNSEFGFGSNVSVSGEVVTWNSYGNIRAAYFIGNGSQLTAIAGANVTGTVANATYATSAGSATTAGTVTTASQPNITSVGTLVSANITGNLTSGNANLGNLATSNYFSGNGSLLSSITGANVTGTVANATYSTSAGSATTAGTVTTAAQLNITSVGSLTGLTVSNATGIVNFTTTANVTLGAVSNLHISGGSAGYTLKTDGAGNLSWSADSATPSGSNTQLQFNDNGSFGASANLTFDKTTNTLAIAGNIASANWITANYFSGAGNALGNIYGPNVSGLVANANYAAYTGNVVTAAQPNITSVGSLTGLTVSNATGIVNFTTTANVTLGSVSNLHISGGSAGYVLKTDGAGNLSWGIDTTAAGGSDTQIQFNDGGSLSGNSNLTFNKTTSVLSLTGNVSATYFVGNGNTLTNIYGPNVTGLVANANYAAYAGNAFSVTGSNVSGDVSGANHANVADLANSVAGANVTGTVGNATHATTADSANSVAGANVSGQVGNALIAGTVYTNAQPNITSVGTLSSLTVTANITGGNVAGGNLVSANYISGNGSLLTALNGSNVTGQVANSLIAGTVYTNAQPNITSVGTLANLDVDGNVSAGNLKSDNLLYANGDPYVFTTSAAGSNTQIQFNDNNSFAGNANLTFNKTTNTLTVDNIVANGAGITYITGSNVSGQVANANIADTVYNNAQPNITSLGTLTDLTVSGVTNLGTAANVIIAGGTAGYVLATNGSGNLSWVAQSGGAGGSGFVGITKNEFTANGVQTQFGLTTTPYSADSVVVNIDGLIQQASVYTLSGSNVVFGTAPLSGQKIEVTAYDNLGAGTDTQLLFNSGGVISGSDSLTFTSSNNTLETSNITASGTIIGNTITSNGNVTASGGYLTLGSSIIAVSGGNAGIFTSGLGNVNIGLASNVTLGGTTSNVTARGNFTANSITSNTTVSADTVAATNLKMNDLFSNRAPVSVTGTTVIDSFPVNKYRTAKYTIRVGSDDGYQSIETLLIHNGVTSYVTVYGSISTSGYDIVLITSTITSGNIELLATTSSANTTVNLIGTYVAD